MGPAHRDWPQCRCRADFCPPGTWGHWHWSVCMCVRACVLFALTWARKSGIVFAHGHVHEWHQAYDACVSNIFCLAHISSCQRPVDTWKNYGANAPTKKKPSTKYRYCGAGAQTDFWTNTCMQTNVLDCIGCRLQWQHMLFAVGNARWQGAAQNRMLESHEFNYRISWIRQHFSDSQIHSQHTDFQTP